MSPCKTKDHPLSGAAGYNDGFARELEKEYALPADLAHHLAGKFGTQARRIVRLAQEMPEWKARVAAALPVIRAEIIYCVRYEMAETIEDLLARRTGVQMISWRAALEAAPSVGNLLAREKGWDAQTRDAAVAEYSRKIRSYLQELGLNES